MSNSERCETYAELVQQLAAYLPSQGPIKDFIHHNTLHAFQHEGYSFHAAIRCAAELYGSREYLSLEEYRTLYQEGKISEQALQQILQQQNDNPSLLKERLLYAQPEARQRTALVKRGGFAHLKERYNFFPEDYVHPLLARLLANYLDQGVSSLNLAAQSGSFWLSLREQLANARPAGFPEKSSRLILSFSPEELLAEITNQLVPEFKFHKVFLLEVLLQLPGWAGLVHQIELNPQVLFFPRAITLAEYTALYLAILAGQLPLGTQILYPQNYVFPAVLEHREPEENETEYLSRLWHEAWELSYYTSAMAALAQPRNKQKMRSQRAGIAEIQAIFCIDDRECSLRRHLEELTNKIETFGMPGFFGIDAMYQGPFDVRPVKQCPAPLTPRYLLRGIPLRTSKKGKLRRQEMNFWHRHANHLYSGWLISHVFSLFALLRLLASVFWPRKSYAMANSMLHFEEESELHLLRESDDSPIPGLADGYTPAEMAERVERSLRQIGLTHSFAPLVFVVGHGASSTNNPYFAAYDCGACSGHSGAINARTFARMANRSDVREILKGHGIKIPPDTIFIAALHDTTRDEIHWLDENIIPEEAKKKIPEIKKLFSRALGANARERSRRFAMLPNRISATKALSEAAHRSEMLFEPRPEYNHATNALAIVGRRLITENTFLDRRAFLNSYDPFSDRDGSILNEILSALVPVCGGINLEYFFSRMDSEIYGAGSKLPHNVVSLLGVANGSEGDLRTGLPAQMTEIHDPLRLLLIVEQKQSIVDKVIKSNKTLQEWIWGGWILLAIYNSERNTFHLFRDGDFYPVDISHLQIHYVNSSADLIGSTRDSIVPTRIRQEASV